MRLNMPEFVHYVLGAAGLLLAWVPLMTFFNNNVPLTAVTWSLWYILLDQILHVTVKREKISIVK